MIETKHLGSWSIESILQSIVKSNQDNFSFDHGFQVRYGFWSRDLEAMAFIKKGSPICRCARSVIAEYTEAEIREIYLTSSGFGTHVLRAEDICKLHRALSALDKADRIKREVKEDCMTLLNAAVEFFIKQMEE